MLVIVSWNLNLGSVIFGREELMEGRERGYRFSGRILGWEGEERGFIVGRLCVLLCV